jgi:hypothetical protein
MNNNVPLSKEESFELFCNNCLIEMDELGVPRNNMYYIYDLWYSRPENKNVEEQSYYYHHSEEYYHYTKSQYKLLELSFYKTTRIGRPEFYKMLTEKYGEPEKRKGELSYRVNFTRSWQ